MASSSRIAFRYAKSLLDLASEQDNLDAVYDDMQYFEAVSKLRDFELMLKSPIIKTDVKGRIFAEAFANRFQDISMKFIQLILRKSREMHLPAIASSFIEQYNVKNNIATVKLTSAYPMSEATLAELTRQIQSTILQGKEIDLITSVDEKLIGGFRLEIDDLLYDASVSHKLDLLRKEMLHARIG